MRKRHRDYHELRERVFNKCNGRFAYCGEELEEVWHKDHLIPKRRKLHYSLRHLYEYGSSDYENLMPSCVACNSCKSDCTLEEFRERIAGRVKQLENDSLYRISKKYGLLVEVKKDIIFYFETLQNNG